MKRATCTLLLFATVRLTGSVLYGQGCSDAGFCTMGAMKPDQAYNKRIAIRLRSIEVGFYRGTTPLTPVIYVATADLNFGINDKTSFQIKLPYQVVRGQLGNTSGLGDISLCLTRNVVRHRTFDLNVSLGMKLPTNGADKSEDGFPLPMYYQTSLGSFDAVAGVSLISRKWLLATGIQHPFNQNKNQFLWSAWESSSEDQEYIHRYANSRELYRGTDIMFRIERNFRFSQWNFAVGMLPIYRLNHDEITDRFGKRVQQPNTTGLAMSALISTGYNFNVNSGVKLLVGHKLVQRDNNPDGLTREWVSTLSYCYKF
ncbi:hypothetical protein WBG78_25925 [Chryseolinea sp. T2]|uniref:hypothetical protein n=1 Tax=Chryseolinea sp. T2 TaxID=3129255 RepID=UPI003076A612